MKQKIVIKLYVDSEKLRVKAMKVVASAGVDSVAVEGDDKSQLVVVGERVDSTHLTTMLRKKVGHAEIVKVEEVKKEEEKKAPKLEDCLYHYYPFFQQPQVMCDDRSYSDAAGCSVM